MTAMLLLRMAVTQLVFEKFEKQVCHHAKECQSNGSKKTELCTTAG